jgi:hypothetical protein
MDCDKACLQLAALLGWDNELKQLIDGPFRIHKEKTLNSSPINSITSKLNLKNTHAMKKLTVERKELKSTNFTQNKTKDLSTNQLKIRLKTKESMLAVYKNDLKKFRDHLVKDTVPANLHAQKFPKPKYSLSSSAYEIDQKQVIKNAQREFIQVQIKYLEGMSMQIEKEIGDIQNCSKL